MEYSGGLGAGKGWHQFYFFISPGELASALTSSNPLLLIVNRRVPQSYERTEAAEYIRWYANYCECLSRSKAAGWELTSTLFAGLTHLDTEVRWDPCPDTRYKISKPAASVASLAPLTICTPGCGEQISVNATAKETAELGLKLVFPKVYSLRSEGHERFHETAGVPNDLLYSDLIRSIKAMTRQARLIHCGQERPSRIWMSRSGWEIAQRHPFLKEHGAELRLPESRGRTARERA